MEVVTKVFAGAAAGAVGVWALDRADWFLWNRESEGTRSRTRSVRPGGQPPAHVVAGKVEAALGMHPTREQHEATAKAVHYSIGVGPAIGYAFARHKLPASAGIPRGLLYGLTLFLTQDEALNSATGLAARPNKYPWQAHARGLVSHLVYGVATEIALTAMVRFLGK